MDSRLCLFLILLLPVLSHAGTTLQDIAFDNQRPLPERVAAIREITGISADTPVERRLCIWDPNGRKGPVFMAANIQRARALRYGVKLEVVPYTSESVIAEELKAGLCDAGLISGLRARLFNRYSGSVDAIGALPSAEHMRILLEVLAHPRSADKMVSGDYVVLGIAPAGAAYVFVNDKRINTLGKAAGKRVAVLDYDRTQSQMVAAIGATPVSTDLLTAPNKFNNGIVDVLPAPLAGYALMELHKGMEPDGGIIDYPLTQLTLQLIGRKDKFPNEVAQLIREEFYKSYDLIMARLRVEFQKVPERWWIDIPEQDKQAYEVMMQDARLVLREQGYYDPRMLTLQRKIRCKLEPSRAECTNPAE